jgi:hypothetical protein
MRRARRSIFPNTSSAMLLLSAQHPTSGFEGVRMRRVVHAVWSRFFQPKRAVEFVVPLPSLKQPLRLESFEVRLSDSA